VAVVEETEEDKANKRLVTLESLFPEVDPEFLHQRAVEIGDNPQQMEQWIAESIENNSAKGFRLGLITKKGKRMRKCKKSILVK